MTADLGDLVGAIRIATPFDMATIIEARRDLTVLRAIGAVVVVRAIPHGTIRLEGEDAPEPGETVHALGSEPAPFCMVAQMKAGLPWSEDMRGAGYVAITDHGRVTCTDCVEWINA